MKKSIIVCAGICAALVLTSCGASKESAYRKAYEKARAQEQTTTTTTTTVQEQAPVVVTPVVQQPATETKVVDNYDNVPVRTENVNLISGAGLKPFSVVVGSFSLKANAESLQSRLSSAGYGAQIVQNASNQMYRVVATTYNSKDDAVNSRDQLRATYPDAWLLYAQ